MGNEYNWTSQTLKGEMLESRISKSEVESGSENLI
jgi:hypothetical protein